mgnify:CR=1 FL=1
MTWRVPPVPGPWTLCSCPARPARPPACPPSCLLHARMRAQTHCPYHPNTHTYTFSLFPFSQHTHTRTHATHTHTHTPHTYAPVLFNTRTHTRTPQVRTAGCGRYQHHTAAGGGVRHRRAPHHQPVPARAARPGGGGAAARRDRVRLRHRQRRAGHCGAQVRRGQRGETHSSRACTTCMHACMHACMRGQHGPLRLWRTCCCSALHTCACKLPASPAQQRQTNQTTNL